MSITPREYENMTTRIQHIQSRKDRLYGRRETDTTKLKKDYGCKSLSDADALLVELLKKQAKTEKEHDKASKAYQKRYADILEGDD